MKPERQRIAIAEACGWKFIATVTDIRNLARKFPEGDKDGKSGEIPNYLNSLDAMHEAEKVLPYGKRGEYARRLDCIYRHDEYPGDGEGFTDTSWSWISQLLHATAAQRAEAFLKTLDLWTDEPTA